MLGRRYQVKSGDTLWDIAQAELGDARQWPRIWRYNNRPQVAWFRGRALPDPHFLLPGQVLLLPVLPSTPRSNPGLRTALPSPAAHGYSAVARPSIGMPVPSAARPPTPPASEQPIAVQYGLDLIKLPPIVHPEAVLTIRMSGDLVLTTQARYPVLAAIEHQALELRVTQSANQAFGSLVREIDLGYDVVNRRLTCRTMLVSRSRTPSGATTAVGFELSADTALPVLRFEFRWPRLEGMVDQFTYTATDVTLTIDATPPGLRSVPPAPAQPRASQPHWLVGAALVATGCVVIGGTLIQDFIAFPAGFLDDTAVVSFGVAQIGAGWVLMFGGPRGPRSTPGARGSRKHHFRRWFTTRFDFMNCAHERSSGVPDDSPVYATFAPDRRVARTWAGGNARAARALASFARSSAAPRAGHHPTPWNSGRLRLA